MTRLPRISRKCKQLIISLSKNVPSQVIYDLRFRLTFGFMPDRHASPHQLCTNLCLPS